MTPAVRLATEADLAALDALMRRAIAQLQSEHNATGQVDAGAGLLGLDRQLVADRQYFVAEFDGDIAGCGGWSARATRYGVHDSGHSARLLDPSTEPARLRALFTDPGHVRRGVGRAIIAACETSARAAGFTRVELVATLVGLPLYRSCGYVAQERFTDLSGGVPVPLIRMEKPL